MHKNASSIFFAKALFRDTKIGACLTSEQREDRLQGIYLNRVKDGTGLFTVFVISLKSSDNSYCA